MKIKIKTWVLPTNIIKSEKCLIKSGLTIYTTFCGPVNGLRQSLLPELSTILPQAFRIRIPESQEHLDKWLFTDVILPLFVDTFYFPTQPDTTGKGFFKMFLGNFEWWKKRKKNWIRELWMNNLFIKVVIKWLRYFLWSWRNLGQKIANKCGGVSAKVGNPLTEKIFSLLLNLTDIALNPLDVISTLFLNGNVFTSS